MALAEFADVEVPVLTVESERPPGPGGDWRDQANCTGRTELFFPPKAERPQARTRREAKAARLCGACAVQAPCRAFARANHEYGYWAGESEEQRHVLGFTVAAPIGIRARRPAS